MTPRRPPLAPCAPRCARTRARTRPQATAALHDALDLDGHGGSAGAAEAGAPQPGEPTAATPTAASEPGAAGAAGATGAAGAADAEERELRHAGVAMHPWLCYYTMINAQTLTAQRTRRQAVATQASGAAPAAGRAVSPSSLPATEAAAADAGLESRPQTAPQGSSRLRTVSCPAGGSSNDGAAAEPGAFGRPLTAEGGGGGMPLSQQTAAFLELLLGRLRQQWDADDDAELVMRMTAARAVFKR